VGRVDENLTLFFWSQTMGPDYELPAWLYNSRVILSFFRIFFSAIEICGERLHNGSNASLFNITFQLNGRLWPMGNSMRDVY